MNNNLFNGLYNSYSYKTPQQLQQELSALQNQYSNQYNQLVQSSNGFNNPLNSNLQGGRYFYVNNYEEVVNAQVPFDGTSYLFIAPDGSTWSKKANNGQIFIDKYNLVKDINFGTSNETNKEDTKDDIASQLKQLSDRLLKLEGGDKE